jgi:hypothetical protein
MTGNRTTELVSRREATTLLDEFLCGYQDILLSRGINASEAVCRQNELIDEYAERIEQAIAATFKRERDKVYDAGFDSGIKATLQMLDGQLVSAWGLDDIREWVDEQWRECES